MRIQARNLGCAGLALAALLASDVTVMTAGSLPGSEARRLSAQETEVHNRQDEERMFLEARRALNREEFDRAAELFQALRDKYPVSNTRTYGRFVPDSYYWEAFGRYREGDLPEALILLDLVRVYREAQYYRDGSTWREGRLYDDVRELRLRIQRQLAEEGDPDAAEEVLRHSEAVLAMDSTEILEMQRQFAENIANMQARWEEAQARFTPDMAAYREMQRQFEARIRELEDVWTGQQARLERELQQSIERYRAQLDSTDVLGVLGQDRLMADFAEAEVMAWAMADSVAVASGPGVRMYRGPGGRPVMIDVFSDRYGPVPAGIDIHPECEDALIEQEALTSLLRLEVDAMPTVRGVLRRNDECTAHLRYLAVNWLADEGTDEARELLMEIAREHGDAQTRRWAVTALADFEDPEIAEVLVSILRDSDEREIQNAAVRGLYRHPSDAATQILVELAADGSRSEELRESVAMQLGSRISADSARAVFHRLGSDEIKLAFLGSMAESVRTGALRVAWILPLVEDPNHSDEMRLSLWKVWAMQPVLNLDLKFLEGFYGDLESAELRDELLYSLYLKAQSDEGKVPGATDKVIEKMIDLVRRETDPEVRKRAIYWLGRTGSERAAAFFMEILREGSDRQPNQLN